MSDAESKTTSTEDHKAVAAEARAKAAEEKAAALEAERTARQETKRRKEADKAAKKAADLDAANSRIAELEARERDAMEKVKALEKQRVDDHLSGLSDEQRAVAEKYRQRMDVDSFLELVSDMFKPVGASDEDDATSPVAPPPAAPRKAMPRLKPQGRELHAETKTVLRKYMNESPQAAERLLEAQHSGTQYRYVVPVDKLIRFAKERTKFPKRLSEDDKTKLFDSIE